MMALATASTGEKDREARSVTLPETFDGWVLVLTLLPIFACSIVGSALTVGKWLQFRRSRSAALRFLTQVNGLGAAGDPGGVLALARADESLAARLVEYVLGVMDGPRKRMTDHAEHAGRQLARTVERGLDALALIATLGPLLGLFGTVVGIVIVFDRLAGAEGAVSPSQLAGGIGTALYTTVAGLVVGMAALVSHRLLSTQADEVISDLETLGRALVDLGGGPES
jgi:biopolymer transport protein ExbB